MAKRIFNKLPVVSEKPKKFRENILQGTVMGLGIGFGSSTVHRLIDSILPKNETNTSDECQLLEKKMITCLQQNEECQFLIDEFKKLCKN